MAGPADGGHDPQLLDTLESVEPQPYEGQAWRVTFDGQEPLRPNIRGARWNPKDVSALFMSTSAGCVRAEFQHLIDLQPRYLLGLADQRGDESMWRSGVNGALWSSFA